MASIVVVVAVAKNLIETTKKWGKNNLFTNDEK
jgi:hypothetical protein